MSLLARCNDLSREAQIRVLEAEAPELTVWKHGAMLVGPSWFLAAAPWSQYDWSAFEDFLAGTGLRYVALLDWFKSQDEVRAATGYGGATFQSPIFVVRDESGTITWSGEGYFARTELARRVGSR